MSKESQSTVISKRRQAGTGGALPPVLALAILWSRAEPRRVGEIAAPLPDDDDDEDRAWIFGRSGSAGTLELMRQRPGVNVGTGPLEAPGISRKQWHIQSRRGVLAIENLGRRELLHNRVPTSRAQARLGDLLAIRDELLVLVVARSRVLSPQRLPAPLMPEFGAADQFGIVGESAAAWELRRQLAFVAGRGDHVLLTGASGSGKELAAHAIHALSQRADARLVSRNAATLPEGLIDAELFGSARDYPNPGMPERPGLIGAAAGGTLFLDEIGELSHALQAHLLRVVDSGEYHRLGESRARRVDLRLVAATNRDPSALKHDLLGRLRLRVRLPGLDKRREDIPLIARHLLRELARRDPLVAERAFPDGDVSAEPSLTDDLVATLVTASYDTNVRELQTRLWDAIGRSGGAGLTAGSHPALTPLADDTESSDGALDLDRLTSKQVLAALDAAKGSRERTWRALGLRSRHQLARQMRRLGIT